jgi:hypothetical protein
MNATILLLLAGLSIAQATEPTGTLTLACQGERMARSSSDTAPAQKQVSMDTIVNFTDRTVHFGGGWPLPIPIYEVTETAVMFGDHHTGLFEGIVIGIIEFETGDMEAVMRLSRNLEELENYYSLKCEPTQRDVLGDPTNHRRSLFVISERQFALTPIP